MNLNDYAVVAMKQAQKASKSGTFGVGGILMDINGKILCEMRSQVINGMRINDPTAHVERQIVDWYLENKKCNSLPEPENCILITSLDPCVMCTGALAQAKFDKIIVIALDDFAGINWEGNDECFALKDTNCQNYVKKHFAYPKVTGKYSRSAFGAKLIDLNTFSSITISSDTLKACQDAFAFSADDIRKKVSSTSFNKTNVLNPAKLDESHPIRKYLANSFGKDFLACSWNPEISVNNYLEYINKEHLDFQGVAYFDMFGNLICLDEDDKNISTQSAFMKVTRKIAAVRNTDPIEGFEINDFFPNPRYGYFVYMRCPDICVKTIMELGAIGSTLENTSEHPIMYIFGKENQSALESLIEKLPPLYNKKINIHFKQILSN